MKNQPPQPFNVRPAVPSDIPVIIELAVALSEFFPTDLIHMIDKDAAENPALVGVLGDEIVGFVIWTYRDSHTVEILWLGVKEDYHGLGLGTTILDSLERHVETKNVTRLIASTLSYTVDYKPYEKVRAFYYNRGFKSMGIQQDYYDGFDRLILLKTLR